ncbi:MAG TPA: pilin [Dokdonella sp.]|uniref:pilin n=1 Tax=Dokdonella sp. TaxID=2291710 RepID=UPI002BE1D4B3|nr:pilin [Dokdonella sp.]HUD42980.1 pilin [Dokdonella sp.]
MRHALITFVSSLLGVLAALLAYRYLAPLLPGTAVTALAASADPLRPPALRPGQALDETMIGEERAIEAIRGDLIAIAGVKTAVTEYHHVHGRMPASNAEAGLLDAQAYRGRSLRALSVGPGGRIELVFDALSGRDGGVIAFVPDLAAAGAVGVIWRCTTADYPRIVRTLPSCEYRAADSTAP